MKNKFFIPLMLLVLSLSSCAKVPNEVEFAIDDITINEFHTDLQKDFCLLNDINDMDDYINNHYYSDNLGRESFSSPKGIEVSYKITTDNGASGSYTVEISENADFNDSYEHQATASGATLYNLKINTKYYYKVNAYYKGKMFESEVKEFTTSSTSIRNIYVDGVENVRDLGGFTLENGKTIKQGLIYRTAQFNYNHSDESAIKSEPTAKGKEVLLKQLKIKTDIDVREKETKKGEDETIGINSSPLGNSVTYLSLPMRFGGSNTITNELNKDSLKAFFEYLTVEEHYPIAFHCVRGTDRTGALAYVLGALCGMNENDLMKDYLFSNFANINGKMTSSNIDGTSYYPSQIEAAEGENMSEKAKNYLMNKVGVSEDTLNQIISILVD